MGWGILSAVTDKREGAVMLNILYYPLEPL